MLHVTRPRIVRPSELIVRLGYCRSHLHRLVGKGVLPPPVKLRPGGRAVGWPESVVIAFEQERDAAARAARLAAEVQL
jgi:predicted DNA-binding transcriptional regulator AlpA